MICPAGEAKEEFYVEPTPNGGKHLNLYYVFEADKAAHKLSEEKAKEIKIKIFEIFSKNIKPPPDFIPLY